jgi:exodeoxyribonuclease V alpha subunit
MSHLPKWVLNGIETGWIGRYEQQLIVFLEEEFDFVDEDVLMAVIFLSLFVQAGHVCLPLDLSVGEWMKILDFYHPELNQEKRMNPEDLLYLAPFGSGEKVPFVIDQDKLYFRSDWMKELTVYQYIKRFSSKKFQLHASINHKEIGKLYFDDITDEPDWQKVASALSLRNRLLIISGGPGTGKTTTVAYIISLLLDVYGSSFRIALTAPTGKAAARMSQALRQSITGQFMTAGLKAGLPGEAKTLHRLLNGYENKGIFPQAQMKKLPYDLIVVDEASMIDLNLMERLLTHTGDDTRLIFLGDKDQLASVEAGSVLADICQKRENRFSRQTVDFLGELDFKNIPVSNDTVDIEDSILYLTKSYRFDSESGIAVLADSVNRMDSERSNEIIEDKEYKEITYQEFYYQSEELLQFFASIADRVQGSTLKIHEELIRYWSGEVWLSVVRRGPFGTMTLNRMAEDYLVQHHIISTESGWYHGRPILITRNDYSIGVFNGDLGVCVETSDGRYQVLFEDSGGNIKRVSPHRIQHFEPAYLITVHKSQGSEFDHVNFLLPERDTQILTKELIYTAVTRARNSFNIVGDLDLLKKGVERKTERFTGLKSYLYPI